MSESEKQKPAGKRRKFLVVADGTAESEIAIHFASLRARHTNGMVTLLAALNPEADTKGQWLGVQNVMREEARAQAEATLHKLAAHVNEYAGIIPELVIREGQLADELQKFIDEDPDVAILVLAAGTGKDGPGPLVTLTAGGGFRIPVTVVPGVLTEEALRALA